MQDRSFFAPSLVIVACGDTIEVTMNGHLVRFVDADPTLVMTVRRSVAFPPLWELLRHLTSPGFWPAGESELKLPAAVLETVFREASLLDAA
ncbi:hypothetical protein [Sabulicella glaciei]|uniref:Uncharacterized protein n=1 Tax=Sabulicella glaciei TaxID=2984948 RepID=A0ABT3NZH6_9PROT|nr:hypothetical protein [Roseococcus sp. MDT2-1-1]MCW8087338.1 hypothetical protein [Roseococcus sp. MDT2-1-1]